MGTAIDTAFCGATLAACPLSALVLSFTGLRLGMGVDSMRHAQSRTICQQWLFAGAVLSYLWCGRHCLLAAVARDSGCLEPVCRCSARMQRD